MTKFPKYQALYSQRNRSALPKSTQDICSVLGKAVRANAVRQNQLTRFRDSYQGIPANAVPHATREIREVAELSQFAENHASGIRSLIREVFFNKPSGIKSQLQQYPDLGWLLVHHGNGFFRQAGIEAIEDAPQCSFEFVAIIYRLNDWVENIRIATILYCEKHLASTSADVIAENAFFLLRLAPDLKRWDHGGRKQLYDVIFQPDVVRKLKDKLLGTPSVQIGGVFRQLLQRPDFDQYLLELSTKAAAPSIRAIATDTLLSQRAKWFVGHRKDWVDKTTGISRQVAEFDTRIINVSIDQDCVLAKAAADKSVQVRRVAADTLIARRSENSDKVAQLAQLLISDKNSSVRSRAEFFVRKQKDAPR